MSDPGEYPEPVLVQPWPKALERLLLQRCRWPQPASRPSAERPAPGAGQEPLSVRGAVGVDPAEVRAVLRMGVDLSMKEFDMTKPKRVSVVLSD
eukprot:CAMPEP_0175264942 /NCGR_PEP_ID=MMETSP0093-20121207/42569_1 /TAXON_ID=311494 /ORGANISM="Alexandrium monilatum, Strain CCMP3105" /LENGTH=93 /DNA_ID=CAMNT_0016559515 /DNA_START=38 /DNA_END=319 /DNA_ORIENTATION=-